MLNMFLPCFIQLVKRTETFDFSPLQLHQLLNQVKTAIIAVTKKQSKKLEENKLDGDVESFM